MFEEKIKSIAKYNLEKLNKFTGEFSLANMEKENISPAVVQFIQADLEYRIYKNLIMSNDSKFIYSIDSLSTALTILGKELFSSYDFEKTEAEKLIKEAVFYTVNFLSLPNRTLNSFIFGDNPEIDAAKIFFKMNYFYYYNHLSKSVNAYLVKKKKISLTSQEFIDLLGRIDDIAIDYEKGKVISAGIKSISEFYNQESGNPEIVPCLALERFLKEKELYDEIKKLNDDLKIDVKESCKIREVYKSLGYEIEASAYFEYENENDETTIASEKSPKEFLPKAKEENVSLTAKENAIIKENEFEDQTEELEEEKIILTPDDELSKDTDTFKVDKETTEIIFEDEIEKIVDNDLHDKLEDDYENDEGTIIINKKSANELPESNEKKEMIEDKTSPGKIDLFELFQNKNISKIVASVFNNDVDDFASAIENLNERKNHEEANAEIDRILESRRIKPNSKEAALFKEIINEYFEQK